MSPMWEQVEERTGSIMEEVAAIVCADIHFCPKPPVFRSPEPDWYEAMLRPIKQIKQIRQDYKPTEKWKIPILIAGDLFDKWNSPPELINWVMGNLSGPAIYTIPGQHDLPHHCLTEIHKSAYWTLVEANIIKHMEERTALVLQMRHETIRIYAHPYGCKIRPCEHIEDDDPEIRIALLHEYKWIPGHNYHTATRSSNLERQSKSSNMIKGKWFGYDAVIYGDNHDGFITTIGKTTIFNCGSVMRRTKRQRNYAPQVGLITKTGNIIPQYLDVTEDKCWDEPDILRPEDISTDPTKMEKILESLGGLTTTATNFIEALEYFMEDEDVSPKVKEIILKAAENEKRAT